MPSYLCAHILPLNGGLDCVNEWRLQAGLFSGTLTAFIIDRYQNLQQNPAQQSAFLLQQSTVLLNQISHQLSSLGAQFPANLSLPGYTLQASASDVRVNTYWFMSLVCSLSAALLATLVQRWARDHMHIFHRYSHPLKIARIRQYLHEGVEYWHMREIAEAVPGLIHISLFLFFIGLADFLFSTHLTVGKFTIIPIAFIVAIYTIGTILPVFKPQTPYRTSFSGLAWYLARRWLFKRNFMNRNGAPKPLSSHMMDGRMQLAMEENEARKSRDEQAIRWLIRNLTEDVEMESLASGIPGSFEADWGLKVWRGDPGLEDANTSRSSTGFPNLPKLKRRSTLASQSPQPRPDPNSNPIPSSRSMSVYGEDIEGLCQRIRHLFETCDHHDSFTSDDEWRKRSRACVETAAPFIFCMDADISTFGEIGRVLSDLGNAEKTRDVSPASLNWSFISCWTCLSIVVIRKLLDSSDLRDNAPAAMQPLLTFYETDDYLSPEMALESVRRIDEEFVAAWRCVENLRATFNGLTLSDRRGGKIEETLRRDKYQSELEQIYEQARRMERVDEWISKFQNQIDQVTHNLIRQLPGVVFDELVGSMPIGNVFDFLLSPIRPQFIYLSPRLQGLSTLSQKRSSMGYVELAAVLNAMPTSIGSAVERHRSMERQFWRLQDMREGGALGFALELYLLSLRRILSTITSRPRDILLSYYAGALKSITSDWKTKKKSLGTLQIILNIVCDMAVRDRGIFSNYTYPDYVTTTEELLTLLGNMVEGQANPYIDDALKELLEIEERKIYDQEFLKKLTRIIDGRRAKPQVS